MFPIVLLPLIFLALGITLFLAAWGVFIKDMSQIVPVLVQMLMFVSPVFYPSSAVPGVLKHFFFLNPIAPTLENVRASVTGSSISWGNWGIAMTIATVMFLLGLAFFQHSREEFADVL
jgi:lipopolysaccharide transport system permease protein